MGVGTRARIIKIGNSRGVRIPKLLLAQAELGGEVGIGGPKANMIIRTSRARGPMGGPSRHEQEAR